MNPHELQLRIKNFALRIVPLCEVLPNKKVSKIIEDQLLRSAFSAAANYRAACNAQSKKAFSAKLSITLEEIDELQLIKSSKLTLLIKEANELTKIRGASRRTATKKLTINN